MNAVFLGAVLIAFVVAGYRQFTEIPVAGTPTPMDALGLAMIDAAQGSVTLAIELVGVMALFLGLMKVAEAGGLLRSDDGGDTRSGIDNIPNRVLDS